MGPSCILAVVGAAAAACHVTAFQASPPMCLDPATHPGSAARPCSSLSWGSSSSSSSISGRKRMRPASIVRPSRGAAGRMQMVASSVAAPATTPAPSSLPSRYALDSSESFKQLRADGMSSEAWAALLEAGAVRDFGQGDLIIAEEGGEAGSGKRVHLVLEGDAQLEVKGKIVNSLHSGDFVGEASFLAGSTQGGRSATARALSASVRTVSWGGGKLSDLVGSSPSIGLPVKAVMGASVGRKLAQTLSQLETGSLSSSSATFEGQASGQEYGYGNKAPDASRAFQKATPVNGLRLGLWAFFREWTALRRSYRFEGFGGWVGRLVAASDKKLEILVPSFLFPKLRPPNSDLIPKPIRDRQSQLAKLKLSNAAVQEREDQRRAKTEEMLKTLSDSGVTAATIVRRTNTPWYVLWSYYGLCKFLDVVYADKPIQRFYFLEMVARMPYFSFLSMLHLYETLGWWAVGSEVRKVHFAEEWSEAHHLRIMESLGGDAKWLDRFLARHAAIMYYWSLNLLFSFSPFLAYNFSELLESHAVDTYTEFLEANEELLKSMPPSIEAVDYYVNGDMYMFDEFQSTSAAGSRRPIIKNLYDVFVNIRDDEMEHVKTMFVAERSSSIIKSPNQAEKEGGFKGRGAGGGVWAVEDEQQEEEEEEVDAQAQGQAQGDRPRGSKPQNKRGTLQLATTAEEKEEEEEGVEQDDEILSLDTILGFAMDMVDGSPSPGAFSNPKSHNGHAEGKGAETANETAKAKATATTDGNAS